MKSWAQTVLAARMTSSSVAFTVAVADVIHDGAGEDEAVLHHDTHLGTQGMDGDACEYRRHQLESARNLRYRSG